jgi:predicted nucleic acid-binding protein
MSGWLLDTNVLSELIRKRPNPVVVSRVRASSPRDLATSAVCVMEMRYGAARHVNGRALWTRIEKDVLALVRVLPVGDAEARRAGELLAVLEARGQKVGTEDVLIAATAQVAGLGVATRNVKHFSRFPGLSVASWWDESAHVP